MLRPRQTGLLTAVLALLGWSTSPLFLRHFSRSIDAFTSNGVRYGFAALVWLPVLLWSYRKGTLPKGLMRAALLPSLFNCLGQVAFALGLYRGEPGILTFGLRTQIVFVAIGAAILFPAERKLLGRPLFLGGMALVLAGSLAMILLGGAFTGATSEGFALSVLAGFLFGLYGLSVRRNMAGTNSILAFAAISQFTALGMILVMLPFGKESGLSVFVLSGPQMALLLLSAVIGIALGHVLYYVAIARLGVTATAGVIQLQPFCVGVASFFLFQERLLPTQWLSGTVAVGGAALMLWVQRQNLPKAIQQTDAAMPNEV